MVETVGMKLRRARKLRQISLDDAARATKIRVARLSDLESDVYTNFANLAYAKGFLTSYGKYLAVDVRPYLEAFADTSTFGLDDYQYLSEAPVGMFRVERKPQKRRRSRGHFVAIAAGIGILGIGLFVWFLYVTIPRLGDLDKLADHQEARERAPHGKSADAPAAATRPAAATPIPVQPSPTPGATVPSDNIASRAGAELAMADPSSSLFRAGFTASPTSLPVLPLPGDGGALREMTLGSSSALPFVHERDRADIVPVSNEGWSAPGSLPANLPGGYRFYVHIPGRNPLSALQEQFSASTDQRD